MVLIIYYDPGVYHNRVNLGEVTAEYLCTKRITAWEIRTMRITEADQGRDARRRIIYYVGK